MSIVLQCVARAIWNLRCQDEDKCDLELEDLGRDHSVWAEARAAITAMREPTPAMTRAGRREQAEDNSEAALRDIFRAMIDEALA